MVKVVGRKQGESNGVGRCSVVGGKQEKFEEREKEAVGSPERMMKNIMCMGNRNSKSFFFDFLETAGISLPFRAMSGEVKIKAQIV